MQFRAATALGYFAWGCFGYFVNRQAVFLLLPRYAPPPLLLRGRATRFREQNRL